MKTQSLSGLLKPYRISSVAAHVGVTPLAASNWYHGRSLPKEQHYQKLADFLRLSVPDLATIIAEDSKQRALARVSERSVA